mmetsp:Transcript_17436/g.37865  ORF Transcript_17436/g.37865 Transcript_17436/m.37865 type:complete len:132 (-) Transcript_17436:632-1027(-)
MVPEKGRLELNSSADPQDSAANGNASHFVSEEAENTLFPAGISLKELVDCIESCESISSEQELHCTAENREDANSKRPRDQDSVQNLSSKSQQKEDHQARRPRAKLTSAAQSLLTTSMRAMRRTNSRQKKV